MWRSLAAGGLVLVFLGWLAPAGAGQTDHRLDALFVQLKAARDDVEARQIESEIWAIWSTYTGGNGEVTQAFERGAADLASSDPHAAIEEFSRVVERAPDFAEGWNKRATAYYLAGDYAASVGDIRRTLALEPRHFGALSGLGLIFAALDDLPAALKAFEAAFAIDPHLPGVQANIDAIKKALAGNPT
jgi:tetratricopeptide (TPR) repeat protein